MELLGEPRMGLGRQGKSCEIAVFLTNGESMVMWWEVIIIIIIIIFLTHPPIPRAVLCTNASSPNRSQKPVFYAGEQFQHNNTLPLNENLKCNIGQKHTTIVTHGRDLASGTEAKSVSSREGHAMRKNFPSCHVSRSSIESRTR